MAGGPIIERLHILPGVTNHRNGNIIEIGQFSERAA